VTSGTWPTATDERIRLLSQFPRQAWTGEGRAASVAIILDISAPDDPHFLLALRSSRLSRHPGQYALPGGRADENEPADSAAFREVEEELGLARSGFEGWTLLDDHRTESGFVITPVITWSSVPLRLQPLGGELAEVFRLPLALLDKPATVTEFPGEEPVHTLTIGVHEVYPPTGAILTQFRDYWFHGSVTRVHDLRPPAFATR
jgi:8-oxo-dGTP pyrophosphatase MutT (NUDIX family)